jgi:hypothetical protein
MKGSGLKMAELLILSHCGPILRQFGPVRQNTADSGGAAAEHLLMQFFTGA